MGNTIYHSECRFSFSLDHDDRGSLALVAGNPLRGQVKFVVKKDLPPTQINLRLTGKEKTSIRVQQGKHSHTYRGERSLCRACVTLLEMSEAPIARGTYVFPFEFATPPSLPSSMDCVSGGGGNSCSVMYKLKVDIIPYKKNLIRNVAEKFVSMASTPLPPTTVPWSIAPKSLKVHSFGFDRGYFAVAARVLDVHIGRGTNLELFLACKNDASASIYQVEVAIREVVTFRARSYSRDIKRTIVLVTDLDLPGVIRGKLDKAEAKQAIRSRGASQDDLGALAAELQSRRNMVRVQVPMNTRDSCSGELITIAHSLRITFFTKNNISNPHIDVPLRIGWPPSTSNQNYHRAPPPATLPTEAVAIPVEEDIPVTRQWEGVPQGYVPNLPDTTIPVAESFAIPVDEHSIRAPVATAPAESLDTGGFATFADFEDLPATAVNDAMVSGSIPPMASAKVVPGAGQVSLEALKEEMMFSIDDYAILMHKLEHDEWRSLLSGITPEDFGVLVSLVNRDTHQPRVVELLAKQAFKELFTCEYGRAAVDKAEDWVKPTMVETVLPLCVDAESNFHLIHEILSDWDKALTAPAFGQFFA